ncbi:Squalene-hopene cyclase C-terminal domain-containing protein [Alkalibacterium subtropicum]|uniref:Squalene-hopene cyclase C-terminal domain-containing protein n=1 Tax=Alkalibacterium subtropicum TaxID=753702 RepID=A0A1I1HNC5_9LACT|nr:hypothetical protein [Alkalibacterium subtropicum]SFC22520.1 Squalene-hopene cyclase C-terminal domain-containing protein [Alkalibacterium subtropicum]
MTGEYNQLWLEQLNYDPIVPLIKKSDAALKLKVYKDLCNRKVRFELCWTAEEVLKLKNKQDPQGFWKYPQQRDHTDMTNLNQYQSFKNLGKLVEMYNLDRTHSAIKNAAEYFFSVQTDQGDFRGIYDKQYTPNFTAGITELLIKAGYSNDERIIAALDWLISTRQNDGGWALPFRTKKYNIDVTYAYHKTIEPDLTQPSSYMITAVVLRAFSVHPKYKKRQDIIEAGELVSRYIFKRDIYPDRQDKKYWKQFVYPFCYADLISVLDSLSLLGFPPSYPGIKRGLQWLVDEQLESGLWQFKISSGRDKERIQCYLNLAVCKIFKQFYGNQ